MNARSKGLRSCIARSTVALAATTSLTLGAVTVNPPATQAQPAAATPAGPDQLMRSIGPIIAAVVGGGALLALILALVNGGSDTDSPAPPATPKPESPAVPTTTNTPVSSSPTTTATTSTEESEVEAIAPGDGVFYQAHPSSIPAVTGAPAAGWDNPSLNIGSPKGSYPTSGRTSPEGIDWVAAEVAVWQGINQQRMNDGKRALTWYPEAEESAAHRLRLFSGLGKASREKVIYGEDGTLAKVLSNVPNQVPLPENFAAVPFNTADPARIAGEVVRGWAQNPLTRARMLDPNATFVVVSMEDCGLNQICAIARFGSELDKAAFEGTAPILELTPEAIQSGQEAIAHAVNNVRVAAGLDPLTLDGTLNHRAKTWSGGVAIGRYPVKYSDLLPQAGFIAAAEDLVESPQDSWLDPNLTLIGIAFAEEPGEQAFRYFLIMK